MPYESILSVTQLAYRAAKSASDYVIKHPVKALTIALSVQSQFADATTSTAGETTDLSMTPYDAYSAFVSEEKPIQTQPTCLPLDELYIHYKVIKNVPTLEEVNIFLFGEYHSNNQHHILKSRFVNQIAEPGDYVFFEGISNDHTFSCDSICIHQSDIQYLFVKESENNIPLECKINLNLSKKFTCLGWENANLLEKTDYLINKSQEDQNIIAVAEQIIMGIQENLFLLSNHLTNEQTLTKASISLMKKIIKEIKDFYKTIFKDYLTDETKIYLSEITNYISNKKINELALDPDFSYNVFTFLNEQLIFLNDKKDKLAEIFEQNTITNDQIILKQRNEQGLIESLDAVKNKPNKKFLYAGQFHLFREKDPVDENDSLWTTRQYLNDYPHAILIPKK